MTQQVLALKWRPRTFNEVIGQPHVVQALSNGLDNDRLHHAFLFTGTRGVGKTTLARIFAKSLNCEKGVSSNPCGECSICREVDEGRFVDLIEIDAASRTRVEDTREILDNVQYAPTRGRYKIYLIDEVHMLSNSSFNALLKTLEEPPSHVKFLLATTDPQKLPVTVLSRCLRFQLKRIQDQEIAGQLEKILISEGIPFEPEALRLIAKAGDGSMRDALSLLDQAIAYSGQNVQFQPTHEMLGLIDTQYLVRVLEALASKNQNQLLTALNLLKSHGLDYYRFLEDLIDAFHTLTMIQLAPEMGESESVEMNALAAQFTPEDLQLFYQIALNGRKDLQNHPNAEVGFEMTLLRMVLFAPASPIGVVEAQKKSLLTSQSEPLETINAASRALESTAPSQEVSRDSKIHEEESLQFSNSRDLTTSLPQEFVVDPVVSESMKQEILAEKALVEIDLPWEDVAAEKDHDSQDLELREASLKEVQKEAPAFEVVELSVPQSEEGSADQEKQLGHSSTLSSEDAGFESDVEPNNHLELPNPLLDSTLKEESLLQVEAISPDSAASLLNNNEEWLSLVSGLTLESVLSGIAHSLVFKSFDGSHLTLERPLSVKDFRVDEAEMRLAMAISARLGANISCRIEYVETLDLENLHERTERLDEERLQQALDSFKQDEVVQYMEQELGAVLLTKTLKPLDDV